MATSVSVNNTTYSVPARGDNTWSGAAGVDGLLIALATHTLQVTGGTFTLQAEVNTGATYGFKLPYVKTATANPSTTGVIRLANNEGAGWRNAANNADLLLRVNATNILEFNGNPLVTLALGVADTALRMNAAGTAYEFAKIVNANVDNAAAIAYSKLNLATSIVNADIGAAAAIAYSKLNLGTSIVNADISASAAIDYSKLNLATSIVNADIGAAAAIARSKIAAGTASHVVIHDGSGLLSSEAALAITRGGTGQATANAALNAILPTQTANRLLKSDGTNTAFSQAVLTTDVSGTLPIANGGTGQTAANAAFGALSPMTTNGDLTIRSGGVPARLGVGVDGQSLRVVSGAPAWADGGAGSGEINLIDNPSASSNTTGWTAATNHTVTRLTAGSPLGAQTSTAFRFAKTVAASTTESSTSGIYYPFTVPVGLRNTPLKIQPYVIVPATGVWRVSVYDGTTRLSLRSDTSGATTLPAGFTGRVQLVFDTTASSAYTLSFTETSGVISDLDATNIIVGPGIQPQGAVVGPKVDFTPVFSSTSLGTLSSVTASYQRVGSRLNVMANFNAGTVTSSTLTMILPDSLTVNSLGLVGSWQRGNSTASTRKRGAIITAVINDSVVYLTNDDYTQSENPFSGRTANSIFVSAEQVSLNFSVEISQWAGSGTVNLGQNDVEYASVAGTWDADISTTVYGPAGAAMGTGGNITATAGRTKTITWQTPVQATDRVQIWGSKDQVQWFLINDSQLGSANASVIKSQDSVGNVIAGVSVRPGASVTQSVVHFARFLSMANDDSPTVDWPTSSAFWVATKGASGAVVGYGHATATASGLVAASGSIGTTRLGGQSGYGSTNTHIRRFSTVITNTSTDVTITQSAANGESFTIGRAGLYSISYTDACSASCNMGISRNSAQLTTSIAAITQADRLFLMSPTGNDLFLTGSIIIYLAAGDVLRAHGDATSAATSTTRTQLTIQRIY